MYTQKLLCKSRDFMADSSISTKVFLGTVFSPALKAKLEASHKWKESMILSSSLGIADHQKKQYIGLFLKHNCSTLTELKLMEKEIREQLSSYLTPADALTVESLTFTVFAQVLIS